MASPVDIYIKDTTPYHLPIAGVGVYVYDSVTKLFMTSGTTDSAGRVSFVLPEVTYEVRFFKNLVSFTNPLTVVVSAVLANVFDVPGELLPTQVATDVAACVVSGAVLNAAGAPAAGVVITLQIKKYPLLVNDRAVLRAPIIVRTDARGEVAFTLLRGARYDAQVQGVLETRYIDVPNLASCSLGHLLFPVVARVDFVEDGPYALSVGAEQLLTPVVTTSSGVVLEGHGQGDVQWTSSNPNVLSVTTTLTQVLIRGVSAGTASIHADRADKSVTLFHSPFDTELIGANTEVVVS